MMNGGGVNLVPLFCRQAVARKKRVRRWTWGVIVHSLLVAAGCAACLAALNVDGDETQAAMDKAARQTEEFNQANASLRPQLIEADSKLAVAKTVGDQPDWSQLLAIISSTVDDDIVLSDTEMDAAADSRSATRPAANESVKDLARDLPPQPDLTINLQGMAHSQAALSQFVLRLERLGLFDHVTLISSGRQMIGSNEVHVFSVSCLLRRVGPEARS